MNWIRKHKKKCKKKHKKKCKVKHYSKSKLQELLTLYTSKVREKETGGVPDLIP